MSESEINGHEPHEAANLDEQPDYDICPQCEFELGSNPSCRVCNDDWNSWHEWRDGLEIVKEIS